MTRMVYHTRLGIANIYSVRSKYRRQAIDDIKISNIKVVFLLKSVVASHGGATFYIAIVRVAVAKLDNNGLCNHTNGTNLRK